MLEDKNNLKTSPIRYLISIFSAKVLKTFHNFKNCTVLLAIFSWYFIMHVLWPKWSALARLYLSQVRYIFSMILVLTWANKGDFHVSEMKLLLIIAWFVNLYHFNCKIMKYAHIYMVSGDDAFVMKSKLMNYTFLKFFFIKKFIARPIVQIW